MEIKDLFDESERIRVDSDEKIEVYLNAHHERFHNLLFWANIAILINFVLIITRVIGLCNKGDVSLAGLKVMLWGIFVLAIAYLYHIWRADTWLGEPGWDKVKVLLYYKADIMNKQIKLISGYIAAYSLLLLCSYTYYKVTMLVSPSLLLQATSPLSLVMYIIGAYALLKCFLRRKQLLEGIAQYDRMENGHV